MMWVELFFILIIKILLCYWEWKTPNYIFIVMES